MRVETQAQADELNERGTLGPYLAANGHMMEANLRWPLDEEKGERDYQVGDEIRYESWSAWCHGSCNHTSPPEDW
jgi:hypothetical protein